MPATRTVSRDALPNKKAKELDIYAAEFAKLVSRFSPSRTHSPPDWLERIPDEAFTYYNRGIATFGSAARRPIERRGRLYLIHTGLLFMWMSWGKTKARERFQSHPNMGTRRAASLVSLEQYRRGGVLTEYAVADWFFQPIGQWSVSLCTDAVRADAVEDPELKASVQSQNQISCDVKAFSMLRSAGAVPAREALSLC